MKIKKDNKLKKIFIFIIFFLFIYVTFSFTKSNIEEKRIFNIEKTKLLNEIKKDKENNILKEVVFSELELAIQDKFLAKKISEQSKKNYEASVWRIRCLKSKEAKKCPSYIKERKESIYLKLKKFASYNLEK